MKYLLTEEEIEIPEGIEITANSRQVTVKGKLGELKRNFRHVSLDIFRHNKVVGKAKKNIRTLKLQMWQAKRKQKCCVSSVASVVRNMIRGVTTGYKFKMALAFAHFPIQAIVADAGKALEIKNFLGEKIIRKIECLPGVIVSSSADEKNYITLTGTDLNNVSQTCALIHQSVLVKEKDIRQFLDGIYVSDARLEIK